MDWNRPTEKPENMALLWLWMPRYKGALEIQMGTFDNGRYYDTRGNDVTQKTVAWQKLKKPAPPIGVPVEG